MKIFCIWKVWGRKYYGEVRRNIKRLKYKVWSYFGEWVVLGGCFLVIFVVECVFLEVRVFFS